MDKLDIEEISKHSKHRNKNQESLDGCMGILKIFANLFKLFRTFQKYKENLTKIEIIKDDITTLNVDTIVNAANSDLLGGGGKSSKLASCYQNSLQLAVDNGCKTVAFPNISTGVYGYPKQQAAEVAMRTD